MPTTQGYWTEGKVVNGLNVGGGQFVQGTPPAPNAGSAQATNPVSALNSNNGATTIDTAITDHKNDMAKITPAPTTTTTPKPANVAPANGFTLDEVKTSGMDTTGYKFDPVSETYSPATAADNPQYAADQKTINDAFANQVAHMDAATQNLISSIRGIYSSRIAEQADANRRELATFNTMNTRFGTSRYAPGVATGVLTADERVGLDRIQKIAAEEAGLIAQANQSLTDKKYAAFVQQRNELNDLRKEKVATLTKLQDRAYEVQKADTERRQKIQDDLTKSLNTVLTDAAKNGATSDVINKIKSATTLADAVNAAGDYLQGGTGIIGEYNFYKKDAISRGVTPVDFSVYQDQDANRKIRVAAASQDPNRTLSATEAQALGVPFGTTAAQAYGKTPTKAPTEAQSKDAAFAQRTAESNVYINNLESKIASMNPLSYGAQVTAEPSAIGNTFVSDEIRQIRQAERNFLNSILRRESGAAISPSEFASGDKQYFPLPGDDAGTLAQKKQNRDTQIKNLAKSAGPALADTMGTPSTAETLLKSHTDAVAKIKKFHDSSLENAAAYDSVIKIAPNATPEEVADMLKLQ